ncbi:thioredoxin family protein [Henriciella sp.]|uniref:DUF1223 domain-containing protein n=1 Tax=Henriciella sp. TaxID=1968823 RepID=UPI00260BFE47|nr:DUF1223 domain-containing protein [Henriciella sp.]
MTATCASLLAFVSGACADTDTNVRSTEAPVLAELFTSQSCSSCPPAEALFAELADEPGLVTIEWHVDYWDDLVYGREGRWEDPYSQASHTRRQRDYNMSLRGTMSVYTPQAIVNGQSELVGSHRDKLNTAIESADPASIALSVARTADGIKVSLPQGQDAPSAIIRHVRLLEKQSTSVKGGENAGRELASRNIALSSAVLGKWDGTSALSLSAPTPEAGENCAILVQQTAERGLGPVLAARYCPEAGA